MTNIHVPVTGRRMGRKKLWAENINLRLPDGAKARMDSLLEEGEDRLDLIRTAIDRELKRREREARTASSSATKADPKARA